MKKFEVIYVPAGVGTFHMESAKDQLDKSMALLKSICEDTLCPEGMLLSPDAVDSFLEDKDPDLIIFQNLTFANGAYMQQVMRRFPDSPLLIWTLREPAIDGGRLRLNSLTGAFSAANTVKSFTQKQFEYVYGSPSEEKVIKAIRATVAAAKVKCQLKELKLAQIGHTPEGFGFGRALDNEMLSVFGVRMESIEARELIEKARSFTDEECAEYLKKGSQAISGLENTPEPNRTDFARLFKAYDEYVTEHGIGALSSRCWPDFFTSYGTPVCAVLGMLNDMGISSSCEADTYGALSMHIGRLLTGSPAFFGDPVSLDEKENTLYFWHCGTAACSLARPDTGACAGVHCNRKIGPTLEFGLKSAPHVTVFRVGKLPDGSFRTLIAPGEVLDMPQQFLGTSMVVRTEASAEELVYSAVKDGWEPHYAVIYGDVAVELEILSRMLGIPATVYR
ncbi:MAG: fucose isomerase [Eubacteriaceae bacterium]|nr:fucose isomerase [Eubacteriaceae bacterium]